MYATWYEAVIFAHGFATLMELRKILPLVLDLKFHVPVIVLTIPTLQSGTQQRTVTVEIAKAVVPTLAELHEQKPYHHTHQYTNDL